MSFLEICYTVNEEIKNRQSTIVGIIICIIFYAIVFGLIIVWSINAKKNEEKWIQEHSRPLNDDELKLLYDLRFKKYIENKFKFKKVGYRATDSYRSSLNSDGRLDTLNIPIEHIPVFLTDLLRHKRHEWIAFVFCDEKNSRYIWLNKGPNNEKVSPKIPIELLVSLAKQKNCYTIIEFHNHPHTQDRWWNLLGPSDQDLKTEKYLSEYFFNNGISLISGLCTQGMYIIYGYKFHENSCPIAYRYNSIVEYNKKGNN